MAKGRPDFWYGQVYLLTDTPTDGDVTNAPTANWAYNHENNADAHHTAYTDVDTDARIAVHTAVDDAHHDVYEQANADADIETHRTTATHTQNQPSDHATPIATHAGDASAHHAKYTDGEVDARIALHVAAADPHTQYQKESEKDVAAGYAALHASGHLLSKGAAVFLPRDGTNTVYIQERTAAENLFKATRAGANDYDAYLLEGGSYAQIVTRGSIIIDRGDFSADDWDRGDLTLDDSWRDLDCSSIAPAGTVAILFELLGLPDAAGDYFALRKNGNTGTYNAGRIYGQVAGVAVSKQVLVFCDSSRVVEYYGGAGEWTDIKINILGWVF